MTTVDEAREAIQQRWLSQWGAATLTAFENESQPTLDGLAAGTSAWVYVIVRHTGGGQETLGPTDHRKFERRGSVVAEIRTPLDRGMKRGADLAHAARAIFEGTSFSGIDFTNGQVQEQGPDGKWYRHTASITFNYHETK